MNLFPADIPSQRPSGLSSLFATDKNAKMKGNQSLTYTHPGKQQQAQPQVQQQQQQQQQQAQQTQQAQSQMQIVAVGDAQQAQAKQVWQSDCVVLCFLCFFFVQFLSHCFYILLEISMFLGPLFHLDSADVMAKLFIECNLQEDTKMIGAWRCASLYRFDDATSQYALVAQVSLLSPPLEYPGISFPYCFSNFQCHAHDSFPSGFCAFVLHIAKTNSLWAWQSWDPRNFQSTKCSFIDLKPITCSPRQSWPTQPSRFRFVVFV
jgi:hypothetical protein